MGKDKITISEIIDLMAEDQRFSKKQTEEFVKILLSTVEEVLLDGEIVKIKDFGTFKPQWNEPRKSVDVNTGNEIIIPGYYKVVFIPDSRFKEEINEPFAHLESVELDDDDNDAQNNLETEEKTTQEKFADEKVEEANVKTEPMRVFEEQASEISKLLMEIESMSPQKTLEKENKVISEDAENNNEKTEDDIEKTIDGETVEEINHVLSDVKRENEEAKHIVNNNIENKEKEKIKEETDVYDDDEEDEVVEVEDENSGDEEDEENNIEDDEENDMEDDDEDDMEVEEEEEDVDSRIPLSYLDREMHKKKKKLKKEKAKKQRLLEIKEYFETHDFDIVREVKNQGESTLSLATPLQIEELENVPISEKPIEKQVIPEDSVERNILENKDVRLAPELTTAVGGEEPEKSDEEATKFVETIAAESPILQEEKQEVQSDPVIESSTLVGSEGGRNDLDDEIDYAFTHQKKKKHTLWWLLPVLLLIVAGSIFAVWKFVPNVQNNIKYYYEQFDKKYLHPASTDSSPAKEIKLDSTIAVAPEAFKTDSIFLKKRNYDQLSQAVVVKQGETMKILAKKYLGDEAYWVYIFEANKNEITNLSKISIGSVVKIPKLDSALVDIKNPATIEYAKAFAIDSLHYTEE